MSAISISARSIFDSSILAHIQVGAAKPAAPVTIDMSQKTAESTYAIAEVLMGICHRIMDFVGQPDNEKLFLWLYVVAVFLFSMLTGLIVKWLVETVLHRLDPHVHSRLYHHLTSKNFFSKTCRIIFPLVFLILIQFTLYTHSSIASWCTRLSFVYIVICVAVSLCTLCDVVWQRIDERENKRKLPLRGVVQIVKLIVWLLTVICVAAILLDKSPGTLLAGIGAFAAVLMLVFKDSILGIVAGVQLAENDSLHVGDWISLPDKSTNGIVKGVSLTEVKILNWDKTISTVPPYTLITEGFKNYRHMSESNTRRIQRSYMIDADSVVPTTPEMLERFKEIPLMKEWIERKQAQAARGKVENAMNSEGLEDGTIETNLGVFRAYFRMWLAKNPDISHTDTCFVSLEEQTASGIPFQVYCFTATSDWIAYEAIMDSVFEHLAVMLSRFNLYTFENPSGRDTIIDGYMSPGKSSAPLFGIPYPLYIDSGTPDCPGIPPDDGARNVPAQDIPTQDGSAKASTKKNPTD